jgi:hypothetical protein
MNLMRDHGSLRSMAAPENGPQLEWPLLDPVAPPIDELPENPTQGQVLKVLIRTLLVFGHLWPKNVQAQLYLKAAIERIDKRLAEPAPMRRAEDTGSFIVETSRRVGDRVGESARSKAQQIVDTPNIDLTPDAVGDIARTEAREAVREALAEERRMNREKQLEAEHAAIEAKTVADAAEAERLRLKKIKDDETLAKEKRERNRLIVVGVVVGTIMLVIGLLFTFAQGRLTERQSQAAAAPAVIPMPVFLPLPSSSPPSVPTSATGATAPAKK